MLKEGYARCEPWWGADIPTSGAASPLNPQASPQSRAGKGVSVLQGRRDAASPGTIGP